MSNVIIQYTIKSEYVEENITLLHDFFTELEEVCPSGLAYKAYHFEDSNNFIHIVNSETDASAFAHLPSYRSYRDTLHQRIEGNPTMLSIKEVGSYSSGN